MARKHTPAYLEMLQKKRAEYDQAYRTRNFEIHRLYHKEDRDMPWIAKKYHISKERVSQILGRPTR